MLDVQEESMAMGPPLMVLGGVRDADEMFRTLEQFLDQIDQFVEDAASPPVSDRGLAIPPAWRSGIPFELPLSESASIGLVERFCSWILRAWSWIRR